MIKNTASQVISFQMISSTDGSNVTTGTPVVYVTGDGGTQATGSGTKTHEGYGCWSYVVSAADSNYDHVSFTMVLTGAISQTVNVYPITLSDYKADVSSLATSSALATVDSNVDAILVDTNELQTNQGDWATATGFSTHEAADIWSVSTRAITDKAGFSISGTKTTLDALNDVSAADVNAQCDTALTDYGANTTTPPTVSEIRAEIDSNSTKLADILIDTGTTLEGHLTDIKGGTFSGTTDSLEAIRNRGDAEWVTADVSSLATSAQVITVDGKIDTIDGIADAILIYTNELQANQDNWVTATGFSTHSATDVKTAIEQAGSSIAQILEDTGTTLPSSLAALNDISVSDIIAGISEGSYDLQEMLRIMFAVLAGKSAGGGTSTITFRDVADTKNRISATVDSNGNRTVSPTLDGA